ISGYGFLKSAHVSTEPSAESLSNLTWPRRPVERDSAEGISMRGSQTVFAAAVCSVAAIGATMVWGSGAGGAAASSITAPAPPTNPRHEAVKSPGHDYLGDYNVGAT